MEGFLVEIFTKNSHAATSREIGAKTCFAGITGDYKLLKIVIGKYKRNQMLPTVL